MKVYMKLSLASIVLCFTGCATVNKVEKSQESTVQYDNSPITETKSVQKKALIKASTKKVTIAKQNKKKPKIKTSNPAPKKPKEVERVCFDKQGRAHNCNYKIPKPYNNNSIQIEPMQ